MERNLEVCDSIINRKLVRNTLEKHGIFIFRSFSDFDATLQLEEKRRNNETWKKVAKIYVDGISYQNQMKRRKSVDDMWNFQIIPS